MKVLRVSASYYPAFTFGGPITADYSFDHAVSKKVDIHVLTTNAGIKGQIPIKKWINNNGVKTMYFPFYGYIHYTFSPSLLLYLIINIKNFDVIHFSGIWNFPVVFGPFIARLYGKPYIITPHGALYNETFDKKKSLLKKIHYKLFAKKNIKLASLIHFTGDLDYQKTMNCISFKVKPLIINLGINLCSEHQRIENEYTFDFLKNSKKRIVFVGRIHPIKGLDFLFESLKEYISILDLQIICIGPDDLKYSKKLLKLVPTELHQNIIFTGLLNMQEINYILRESKIFILPSYSENFGMTIIEAMSNKIPVITTDKVGIKNEIVDFNAGIVISHDKSQLIKAIKLILNDQDFANSLTKNANILLNEKFNLFKNVEFLIEKYKILNNNANR